jgi:hypothetical protein
VVEERNSDEVEFVVELCARPDTVDIFQIRPKSIMRQRARRLTSLCRHPGGLVFQSLSTMN